VENHNQVHLEFDLELLVDECRAGINLREQHIQWDFKAANNIPVGHLDVLDFSSVGLILEGLYSYQLDFDRLYLKI